jgi:regulator of RNase E activity RraA
VRAQLKPVTKRDLARFKAASAAQVADAMKHLGYANYVIGGMRPLSRGARETTFAGLALTLRFAPVLRPDEDPELPFSHYSVVAVAGPANVLVIDTGGAPYAFWGGSSTAAATERELGAVVIDGYARDLNQIADAQLPILALGHTPETYASHYAPVDRDITVRCGGARVRPGDVVFGDPDGILVIPSDASTRVLEAIAS